MTSEVESNGEHSTVPESPGLLVDPPWLEDHLDAPGLRPVDLRDMDSFVRSHIPGSVHLDLAELGSSAAGRDNVLVPPGEFAALMRERGISSEDTVVAYDDQWGLAAARLLWALRYYGHARVAILNGGWDRWQDEGRPVATSGDEEPRVRQRGGRAAAGQFEAVPHDDVYADTERVTRAIETGSTLLLDVRTPVEFENGHLPSALSWDWFNAVPDGSWNASRDPDELRTEWRELGLDPSREITVYCRSGMRAAHTWLILRNAGFDRVRLYDGSWQEWSMKMSADEDDRDTG